MTKTTLIEQLFGEMAAMRRSMHAGAERLLGTVDLTRPQVEILFLLLGDASLSVGEIASRTGVTNGAATQTLESMVRRGLITRQADEHDRRISRHGLSPEGNVLATRIKTLQTERLRELMGGLEEAELEAFVRTLRKLNQLTPERSNGTTH